MTIAHRLETVVHYDRILVLENGQKLEVGSPEELMNNEGSVFLELVRSNGTEFEQNIRKLVWQTKTPESPI